MTLLVLGSVAFDDVRTPAGSREKVLGGSATYFAWASATLVKTHLVAAVGRDFPVRFEQALEARGIGLEGLHRDPVQETFYWKGYYGEDLNLAHTSAVHINVLGSWRPRIPDHLRAAPYVFLANDQPSNQRHALDQLQKPRLVLCDTRDLWIEKDPHGLLEVIRRTDGIILNDGEARLLTREKNLIRAGKSLHSLGSRIVIIKKGEHGAFLSMDGRGFALPAYPVEQVVDPTGAGDSFAGGLMAFLALVQSSSFSNLKQAMLCGTIAASFCVEDFSLDRMRDLTRVEFDARLEEFRGFLSI